MKLYIKHYGTEGMKWGIRNGPPYPIDPVKKAHLKTGEMDKDEYIYAKELKRKYKDGLDLPGKEKEYVYELLDNQLTKEQKERALVFCNSQYYTYGAINLGHNNYTIISKKGINGRKVTNPVVNDVLTEMFGVNWEDYDEPV